MNKLIHQFPDATKKQVRREKFSFNAVLWSMIGIIVLLILTMAGMFDPTFHFIDALFESWKLQLAFVMVCLGVVVYWTLIRKR